MKNSHGGILGFFRFFSLLCCLGFLNCARPPKLHFIVIGDTRPDKPNTLKSQPEFLRQIQEINNMGPELVINTGDLIDGHNEDTAMTIQQWDVYDKERKLFKVPYYQVPGNHDIWDTTSQELYQRYCGDLWFAIVRKNALFLVLNSVNFAIEPDLFDKSQLVWLEKTLEQYKDVPFKFVFLHHPLWTTYQDWKLDIHPLLVRYKINAVFAGHIHQYCRFPDRDGIRYYVTGGGGAQLSEITQAEGAFFHYLSVNIDNNRFKVSVVRDSKILPDTVVVMRKNNIGTLFRNKALIILDFLTLDTAFFGKTTAVSQCSGSLIVPELNKPFRITAEIRNIFEHPVSGTLFWKANIMEWEKPKEKVAFQLQVGQSQKYSFDFKLLSSHGLDNMPKIYADIVHQQSTLTTKRSIGFAEHVIRVPVLNQVPLIDGNFGDSLWSSAAEFRLPPARLDSTLNPCSTLIKVAATQDAFVLAIQCHDPYIKRFLPPYTPDQLFSYRKDDYVEIYLDNPQINGFYKISINPYGNFVQNYHNIPGDCFFDFPLPNPKISVVMDSVEWRVECLIPFSQNLEWTPPPSPTDWLGFNVDRVVHWQEKAMGKSVIWCGEINNQKRFGRAILGHDLSQSSLIDTTNYNTVTSDENASGAKEE